MFWKKKEQAKAEGLAWFSYAVMLPDMDEDESEVTVIGNLIIKNTGNTTLNNPMICITYQTTSRSSSRRENWLSETYCFND